MKSNYFQGYRNYFWQWEENGSVLAIPEGNTIAYKEEVAEILEMMASQGLPRFGSLLSTLIALTPKGRDNLDHVFKLIESEITLTLNNETSDVKNFLVNLSQVPEGYKKGQKKIILLREIFKNCHNITSLANSSHLAKQIRIFSLKKGTENNVINNSEFQKDFRVIAILSRKFPSSQSIVDALSNLPDLDETLELESTSIIEPEGIIDELILDHRTQKVGTLVKTIWSGINLPFHNSVPSQQPFGGASDISNKGTFDQLLISEYANEDHIFLSRLANNEVLYLSRESPPESHDIKRVILIDVSLKNWGTSKIVSFATMLAIAKHPKSKIDCEVFVIGDTFNQIDIDSLMGIVDGLEIVEASLNGGNGLKEYFQNHPNDQDREIFVLTERSTPYQNTFHQVINEFSDQIDYWIYNDAQGKIDLYKKLKKSKKHIQHLELPLNRLWSNKKRRARKENEENTGFYPVLLKKSAGIKGFRTTRNGEVFMLDKEKNILRLYNKNSNSYEEAWDVFHEKISVSHNDFEIGLNTNGDYLILSFDRTSKLIYLINSRTNATKQIEFKHWKSISSINFVFYKEKFYHFNNKGAWSIDQNGDVCETDIDLKSIFDKKNKEVRNITPKYKSYDQVLKNAKRIGINSLGNLVINNFELMINSGGHIKLDMTETAEIERHATKERDMTFRFDDGSVVELNRLGLLILRSSDGTIPTVFFPSLVDAPIGIATSNVFAGEERFFKEPKFEIFLKKKGSDKLSMIRLIKEVTGFGLRDASSIFESVPCNLSCFFSNKKALKAKTNFEKMGAEVEIIETNPEFNELKKIKPKPFFEKYISQFTNTILYHGNKN